MSCDLGIGNKTVGDYKNLAPLTAVGCRSTDGLFKMLTQLVVVAIGLLTLAASSNTEKWRAKRDIIRPRNGPGGLINGTSANNGAVSLNVLTLGGGRNATAPLLYGWQFEDINVCIFSSR